MPANSVLARMAVVISAQTAEFNRAMAASSASMKSFKGTVRTVGSSLGIAFGATAIYRGLEYGIGVLSDFEKEMSAVRSVTNATDAEFATLTKSALELGGATLYGAKAVAELQLNYARLGFTTKEITDATSATIDLATATGEDLAKSADIAGVTIRAFGLRANETRRVADILAVGFNKTALGLDNFGEAIKYVAPVAAAQNITLEETVAVLGTLADAGIRGSLAGTATRKIFSLLGGTTGTINERFKQLAATGFTNADAFDEVGRTAQSALLTLVKYTDKTDELTKETRDANGEIAKMAAIMSENLAGDATKLDNAFEGFLITIGNTDAIRNFTRELAGMFNELSGNKTGQINTFLDRMALAISEGFREKGLVKFVERLKEIRKETGQPIDENSVTAQLTQRYKLSSEQAYVLAKAIREVNTALSFDESVISKFDKFAQGYKDITKAAGEFIALQRRKILANKGSEIAFGQRGDLDALKAVQADTANYEKAIQVVKDYVKVKTEVGKTPPPIVEEAKETLGVLQKLEKQIKEYEDAQKKAFNPLDISFYAMEIDKLREKIEKLKKPLSDFSIGKGFGVSTSLAPKDLPDSVKDLKLLPDPDAVKKEQDAFNKTLEEGFTKTNNIASNFASSFGSAIADIGGSFAENGFQDFGKSIIQSISNFMKAFGKQLIALGAGFFALQALEKLGPIGAGVAIAAGIALVAAAGATAQSGLSGASNGIGSASARLADTRQGSINVNVTGELVGQGSTLKAVLRNTDYQSSRTGG